MLYKFGLWVVLKCPSVFFFFFLSRVITWVLVIQEELLLLGRFPSIISFWYQELAHKFRILLLTNLDKRKWFSHFFDPWFGFYRVYRSLEFWKLYNLKRFEMLLLLEFVFVVVLLLLFAVKVFVESVPHESDLDFQNFFPLLLLWE